MALTWWELIVLTAGALLLLPLLLVPLLAERHSGALRYNGCFAVYVISVSVVAVAVTPLFCINPRNVKNCLYVSFLLRHVTRLLGISWELRGSEYLSKDQGAVIVANHQTTLDILGMFNIWPVMGRVAAIARKEVFYVWPFGLAAWLGGVVFIDRSSPARAKESLAHASHLMRFEKTKLWIFPEGTRNKSGSTQLLPFKRGAFHVAVESQVPLLPVVYSPYTFIDPKRRYFGHGRVVIQALPPIPTEGLTAADIPDLVDRTRREMQEAYDALCKEVRGRSS